MPCRNVDYEYASLVRHVLENGVRRPNRTGTDTLSLFGYQYRLDLAQGFPALTTKKLHWPSIVHELLWFLRGDTNVAYLQQHGVSIWNEWADADGDCGPIYGEQWRCWESPTGAPIDQISQVIDQIKKDPYSRRLVVSAWNVADLPRMVLAPCHCLFQFYVQDGRLSCQLYQRSADVGLGVPFNIASYALLTHIIAAHTGLKVGEFIHSFGDVHVYTNHVQALQTQLTRTPYDQPYLNDVPIKPLEQYDLKDFVLIGYRAHPSIKMEVAV